ncbi:hypothetical protein CVIRNUC_003915 [Coccomyxa viridis]|uniref:Fungal lipase-type domain-containing protein n=1 Tax=Coccomyxa viridis TaxID=1274662 RepID=A0AAV1I3Q8_9CHLO|nr:hypothetical protein CVIRNUC_003915 [Coccomyxa viridis]
MKRRQRSSDTGTGRGRRSSLGKEEEPEIVENPTCPILKKISHAFVYAKKAVFSTKDGELAPGSRVIRGLHDAEIHLAWQEQDSVLVVAFKSPEKNMAAEMISAVYDERRMPNFLANVAPEAEVHSGFLDILDSFQQEQGGREPLAETVKELTGDSTPRRIIMTGFCVGGSLATIAACWAALQSPTSDVRCITFGAPHSGNAAFVEAFRWLVGVSYRVSFGSDPVANAGGGMFGSFAAVAGAIHLDEGGDMETQESWMNHPFWADKKDHCVLRYKKALCRQINKQLATQEQICKLFPCPTDACSLRAKHAQHNSGAAAAPAEAQEQATAASANGAGPTQKGFFGSEHHSGSVAGAAAAVPAAVAGISGMAASAVAQQQPSSNSSASPDLASVPEKSQLGEQPQQASGAKSTEPGLSSTCTLSSGFVTKRDSSSKQADETADEREARHESAAAGLFRSVVAEATGGRDIGVAKPPHWLTKAFSLVERDDLMVNLDQLTTLQKVLVIGKISNAVVLAGAAYQDEAGYARMTGLPREKTRLLDDKGKTDTQVHVSWIESGTAVFSFRGTESTQDGLQDLKLIRRNIDFLARSCPGAKAHTGFLQQFAAVIDDEKPHLHLGKALAELSGGRQPNRVICTGHSLGGALATLGAAWSAIEYPDADVRCITFGSPRVANRKFKKAFHGLVGTSLRLAYGGDPVPNFPSYRYDHVGCSLHVKKCGIELHARPWHWGWRPVLGDHFLGKYTAGVYSHIPGGLAALPKFDDTDFKIPANVVKESRRVGCLGLTDAVEAESSSGSESGSPRHDESAAAQQEAGHSKKAKSNGKKLHRRSVEVRSAFADEAEGETGQPLSEDSSGSHNRHSSMPILSKIRSSINRRLSSGKDTPKMTAAAQQAVAAH